MKPGQCPITPLAHTLEASVLPWSIVRFSPTLQNLHHSSLEVVIIAHYLTPSYNVTRRCHKMSSLSSLSYGERASKHQHPVAKRFFETAEAKKSNLIVSADFTTTEELLKCADSK